MQSPSLCKVAEKYLLQINKLQNLLYTTTLHKNLLIKGSSAIQASFGSSPTHDFLRFRVLGQCMLFRVLPV